MKLIKGVNRVCKEENERGERRRRKGVNAVKVVCFLRNISLENNVLHK